MQEHLMRRRSGRSRGQALVEFALIIPIFLAVLLAILEGGYYAFTLNSLNRAVQEGGRHAAIVPPPIGTGAATVGDVQNRVSSSAVGFTVAPASVNVTMTRCSASPCSFTTRTTGDAVSVSFTYTYTPLTAAVLSSGTTIPINFVTEYFVE
jgi:Flp pilus assembly protein TadG